MVSQNCGSSLLLQTPDSVLIYEGSDIIKGSAAIVAKLNTLPPVRSQPQTVDVEPGPTGNLLVIFVTGQLMVSVNKRQHEYRLST